MASMMTTSSSFPCEDITHKPLRSQSENLRVAQQQAPIEEVANNSSPVIAYHGNYTIERAISTYSSLIESEQNPDLRSLYDWTIKTLMHLQENTNIGNYLVHIDLSQTPKTMEESSNDSEV